MPFYGYYVIIVFLYLLSRLSLLFSYPNIQKNKNRVQTQRFFISRFKFGFYLNIGEYVCVFKVLKETCSDDWSHSNT